MLTWMVGIPDGGNDITGDEEVTKVGRGSDDEEVAKVGRGSDDEEVAKVGNEMTTTNEDVIWETPASGKIYIIKKTARFFDITVILCSRMCYTLQVTSHRFLQNKTISSLHNYVLCYQIKIKCY